MNKYYTRSDLAIESLGKAILDKDYKHSQKRVNQILVETFEILRKSDLYPHDVGHYIELSFENYDDIATLSNQLKKQLIALIKQKSHKKDPLILFVGLGNATLTSDSIGSKIVQHLRATHHYHIGQRHLHQYYDTMNMIPGVMAHTGMETADIIGCIVKEMKPDLIIAFDALCALSYEKLCHVIQINDAGIYPGSGVGNHRKALNEANLGVPTIAIGIPTVIHVSSLMNEIYQLLEGYFTESMDASSALKVGKRKKYEGKLSPEQRKQILGEIGELDNQQRVQLLSEILQPLDIQYIMSDKQLDYDVEMISKIISASINDLKN
ncbi:MAG: GPR endopeptidase [Erysipelotrichaceae bacterium]|nr:GPR endopeptidase [Erysipelotrichaceae bacterium]